jgi:hypothetical protein
MRPALVPGIVRGGGPLTFPEAPGTFPGPPDPVPFAACVVTSIACSPSP